MARAQIKFKLDTRKLDAVVASMRALSGSSIKVGVLGDAGSETLTKATANEFGTKTIPERSFLRSTLNSNQGAYVKAMRKAFDMVAAGRMSAPQAMGIIGLRIVSDVQQTMTDLVDPPLAKATVDAKGSSNPLIDTGRLRASISFEVVKAGET